MRLILFTLIIVLFSFSLIAQGVDYSGYNSLLHKFVKIKTVDYKGLKSEKDSLLKFTGFLEKKSPDSHPDEFPADSDKLAYWLNAYNAFILKLIAENYPVESIKDINFIGFTVWLNKNLIGGEEISFKSLEDDIIRSRFGDPRIHFAINCASASCPPLAATAYLPEQLDKQLNKSAIFFINDSTNFFVDDANQTLYMSSIFDWYDDDFLTWLESNKGIEEPVLLDYIAIYLNDGIKDEWRDYDLEFFDYDWDLNDIDR